MILMKASRWTEEEVEFLIDNYDKSDLDFISDRLKRSKGAIKSKAFQIGILKKRDTNLLGRKFGRLKVVKKTDRKQYGKNVWVCECDCGGTIELNASTIKSGNTRSCGCFKKDLMAAKASDLLGRKFGRLTAIEKTDVRNGNKVVWRCSCSCGESSLVDSVSLTSGNTKSCGCLVREKTSIRRKIDLTGKTFGRLTAIKAVGISEKGQVEWLCKCECGNETTSLAVYLNGGRKKSCGCLLVDNALKISEGTRWTVSGERNHRYNPKLTDEERLRNRYQLYGKNMVNWRTAVYKKDKYTCQTCNQVGGKLNAHHMDSWNSCLDGRFDIENGKTLCFRCHTTFHKQYGYGNNTKKQFYEFKKKMAVLK